MPDNVFLSTAKTVGPQLDADDQQILASLAHQQFVKASFLITNMSQGLSVPEMNTRVNKLLEQGMLETDPGSDPPFVAISQAALDHLVSIGRLLLMSPEDAKKFRDAQ